MASKPLRTYQITIKKEEAELLLSLIKHYKESAPKHPQAILNEFFDSMTAQMIRQDQSGFSSRVCEK